MADSGSFNRFKDFMKNIDDPKEDHCWFCNKTPDEIKAEFFERMKNPPPGLEDLSVDDILIMTYKTKKPICAACYFAIKHNPELIKEILQRPEDEIWGAEE